MTARYLTVPRLSELESKLSDRDWRVVAEVAALRFVSGSHLARLCFARGNGTADTRAARRALLRLNRLDVLARLPRPVGGVRRGSAGFVYYLAPAGQRLSMGRGWLPPGRPRRPSAPGHLFVSHALAVAELHCLLVEGAHSERFELLKREAEPACWRGTGEAMLKPDSHVRLAVGDYEYSYLIEVDRGTEGSGAIRRQLGRYVRYHRSGREQRQRGVFPKVLWLATDAERARVIAELIGRLPTPERALFAATTFGDALAAVAPEAPADNALKNTYCRT
jgi:hypothetical protein